MGIRECVEHGLLNAYPVLYERTNDMIVHIKFTILLLPGGTIKITGLPMPEGLVTDKVLFSSFDSRYFHTYHTFTSKTMIQALPEDVLAILAENPEKKKKDKKKKDKKKSGGAGSAAATAGGEDEA